jgi:serine/threonine-protein kinase
LAAVTDPRIGTTLDGRYQIMDALAAGGMGVVYRGERLGLGRHVAIKFLHAHMATDSSFLKRFAIEAKAMAKLQHPHCAAVIDFGVDGQDPYVVMDLVGGESLRSLLDRGRLPAARALVIMRQVLSGLAHAHAHGITHRDIKPDNIMVEASGSFGDQVRILDFGLAKLNENASGLTIGFVVGTPSYMAPEQTLAQAVDERTDIYACGVVLFEMLTGSKPFRADEAVDVLRMHREAPPPRLADVAPDAGLSDEIEGAVLQALAKDPSHRFASAAAFATALDHVPEAATRPGSAPPMVTPASRNTPAPLPALGAQAHAGLGTEPTEWSHQQPGVAQPAPGPRTHATEHLGASEIEVVVSDVAPARPAPSQNLGASQLEAFAAALADSSPRRPLATPDAGAPHGHDPAFTTPGRALTPLPEAYAARPDTGFPVTRSDTDLPSGRRRSGLMTPYTEPSIGAPVHAWSGRRKLWLGAGAGAGVLILLVVVGLLGDDASQAVVTGEPSSDAAGQPVIEPGDEPGVEIEGEPGVEIEGEPGVEIEGEPGAVEDEPGAMGTAGTDIEAAPDEQPGAAAQNGSGASDPARLGVKSANQVTPPPSLAQAQTLLDQGRTRQARDLLEKLRRQDRDNAHVHYLLGKAYFQELWVQDGLDAFRDAIALDPKYRSNRDLIESAAVGLANDSHHYAVSRFLVRDIGRDARPALENMAARHHRDDVRARATRALGQIR